MKHSNKLTFVLLTIFTVSCSSEPKSISEEDMTKVMDKIEEVNYLVYTSSGDLTYDFPAYMKVIYFENGKRYSQVLDLEGIHDPKEEKIRFDSNKNKMDAEDLINFDITEVFNKAVNAINKETNNEFEGFTTSMLSVNPYINHNKKKKVRREITIQATKKGEESEYKFSRRKVTSTKNFYEFKFDILENSEVKFNK